MQKCKLAIILIFFSMYLYSCNVYANESMTEDENLPRTEMDIDKAQDMNGDAMLEDDLSNEELEQRRAEYQAIGAKQYMMNNYGLTEDEVDGYDINSFVQYWQILSWNEENVEYVHILWNDEKDNYKLTDEYIIYHMYNVKESDRRLTSEDTIVRIGGYRQIGNNPIHPVVVDVEKGVFYVDDTTQHEIPTEELEYFKDVNKNADVENWVLDFSDYEPDNTGSVAYEVRFELDTGEVCIYSAGGSTSDNFPPGPWSIVGDFENLLDSWGRG